MWDDESLGAKYHIEDVPAALSAPMESAREKLLEVVADCDEKLLEKYLEGQEITEDEIRGAVRKGTLAMKVVPVICGSAFKNKGVQPLLDAVVDYLPSPLDIPPVEGLNPDNGRRREAPRRRQGAVFGSRLQDHERSLRRHAELLPRLLRVPAHGFVRVQRDEGT